MKEKHVKAVDVGIYGEDGRLINGKTYRLLYEEDPNSEVHMYIVLGDDNTKVRAYAWRFKEVKANDYKIY